MKRVQVQGLSTSDCKRAVAKYQWKSDTTNRQTAIACWTVSLIPESVGMWRLETSVLQSDALIPCIFRSISLAISLLHIPDLAVPIP